jgi:nucleoside-triphosphatase THEP1
MAVISALKVPVGGFFTERVFAEPGESSGGPCRGGRRIAGFIIRDLATGGTSPIALFDESGDLRPRPEGFETVGVESLRSLPPDTPAGAVGLIVMDELGFLERDSPRFQEAVFSAIRGPLPVLGTLKDMCDSVSPFLEMVKASGIRLLRVTEQNRARVEKEARELLAAWVSEHPS